MSQKRKRRVRVHLKPGTAAFETLEGAVEVNRHDVARVVAGHYRVELPRVMASERESYTSDSRFDVPAANVALVELLSL